MSAELKILDIINQLIAVDEVDLTNPREEHIRNLTPISNVSVGPTPPLDPEFSFYVCKSIPKGKEPTFNDMMTLVTSEYLYTMYMKLDSDSFKASFNEIIYCYVSKRLEEARKYNVTDSDNIWIRPNAAFVEWFHVNGIDLDDIKSFTEIEDDEYTYYKEKGLSEAKIAYYRLYELTNKYIRENPKQTDGTDMSIRKAVIIVYNENKNDFPTWAENSLNKNYHLGQNISVNI